MTIYNICAECGASFPPKPKKNKCNDCLNAYNRKRYKEDPNKSRNANYKHRYGISLDDYNVMLKLQDNRCAICNADSPGKHYKNFMVDHDKETNVVRGLLCWSCNIMIGHAYHKQTILKEAITYLDSTHKLRCEN